MHFTHYLANRIRSFNTAAGGVCLPAGTHSPLVIIINSILIFFEVVQLHSVHSHAATYAIPGIINTQTQGTHVTIQGVYLGVWCLCSHVTGCLVSTVVWWWWGCRVAGAGRAAWTQCRSGHGAAYTVLYSLHTECSDIGWGFILWIVIQTFCMCSRN